MTSTAAEQELLNEAIERVRKVGVLEALARFRNDGSFEGALITVVSGALAIQPTRPCGK